MKLTYIYHSGYTIEGEREMIIIDFWKDSADGFVKKSLATFPGKIYVLCSHWHPDHFNPAVLDWRQMRSDIQYVFSKDILKKKHLNPEDASFLIKGDEWQDENIKIKAFGSTDIGISFLIETENKKIFHAGDLNNWHWDEESTPEEAQASERLYLQELKTLANVTKHLDLAMFPVDARLGKNYMRGAQQFVEAIHTDVFAPMHFGDGYASANKFQPIAEHAGGCFVAWTKTGESIHF